MVESNKAMGGGTTAGGGSSLGKKNHIFKIIILGDCA
jgi:hypothetical protein